MVNKRKIKFRVWDKLAEHMIYPNSHMSMDLNGNVYNLQNGAGGNDYELMQFTELYDCDGKEIYEGDIIDSKYRYGSLERPTDKWPNLVVQFDSGMFYAEAAFYSIDKILVYYKGSGYIMNYSNFEKSEVIGNIFENPELLDNNE